MLLSLSYSSAASKGALSILSNTGTYAQIVGRVVAVHPEAKTSARSVASTAAALRKGGTDVPKRQPAPTAKAVSEDPAHGS